MKRVLTLFASSLLLGLGLLGLCSLAAFFGVQRLTASAHMNASPSFVRVIHASPDVGTADVFVDGSKLLSSFAFGSVTDYAAIPAGPHKVQISLVGKGIGASVINETLSVTPGLAYTVAAIGTQATGLSLEVFVDNNLLSPNTTKLRVYQLSPDAGAVSVSMGANALVQGSTYQSASHYLVVPAGGYTFTVDASANNAVLSTSTTLNANMVESLFVVGMFNGSPQSELVVSQAAGLPNVPNTGSDPNAVAAPLDRAQPITPWSWPLAIVSLLFVGSGLFMRRTAAKR